MFGRLIGMLVMLCVAVVLIVFIVVNRHEVLVVLDPFNRADPELSLNLHLGLLLIVVLAIGAFLGGTAGWLSQGKWRKTARQRTQEAMRWKAEAERLTRERDERVSSSKQLLAS